MNHRQVLLRGASKLCSGYMGSPSCGLRLIQAGKGLKHDVLVTTSFPAMCERVNRWQHPFEQTIRQNVPAIQAGRFRPREKR